MLSESLYIYEVYEYEIMFYNISKNYGKITNIYYLHSVCNFKHIQDIFQNIWVLDEIIFDNQLKHLYSTYTFCMKNFNSHNMKFTRKARQMLFSYLIHLCLSMLIPWIIVDKLLSTWMNKLRFDKLLIDTTDIYNILFLIIPLQTVKCKIL